MSQQLLQRSCSSPGKIQTFNEFVGTGTVSELRHRKRDNGAHQANHKQRNPEAVATRTVQPLRSVKAVITAKAAGWTRFDLWVGIDSVKDWVGRSMLVELVSSEVDPGEFNLYVRR